MKRYNVYGMGNALVDMEYKVSSGFFEKMQVEKGVMTLVDEKRQAELLAQLGGRPVSRAGGGSAANTMIALCQLGGTGYYACKVASDLEGKFYLRDLKENGVEVHPDRLFPGCTGKCLVMVSEDADRTLNTFLGITATYSPDIIDYEELAKAEYLYMEGYLVAGDGGFNALMAAKQYAKRQKIKTALTFSDPFMVKMFKERFQTLVEADGKLDLIFCNEAEAKEFTGKENIDEAKRLLEKWAHSFVITIGAEGSLLYEDGRYETVKGEPVNAIDTNGAGDMFAGAFLYGITHGLSKREAAKLGNRTAGELVKHFGARLNKETMLGIKSSTL